MTPMEICDVLSQILDRLPKDVQEAFKLSKPEFAYIHADYDAEKFLKRREKFQKSMPNQIPDFTASNFLFQLSKNLSANVKEMITKAIGILTTQKNKDTRRYSTEDVLYLVRIWAFFSEKKEGVKEFDRYYSRELENILRFKPLSQGKVYQGIVFAFRADSDLFKIKKGIRIRRLYPWEYTEWILKLLKTEFPSSPFKIPAHDTLAQANFILEINLDVLKGKDQWEKLRDFRTIVDIISVAAKGHAWVPLVEIQKKGFWVEGVKGRDFSGRIGVVPSNQTPNFIKHARRGLDIRNNTVFKAICRSLRQEEEEYGFEFRLVRLFHSLELLLGAPGIGGGMRLAWLLGTEPDQRNQIFEEFMDIKDLRDKITHEVLLYDLMTRKKKSNTLSFIKKLHDWLFESLAKFLYTKHSLKEWKAYLGRKLFGE